MVKNLENNEMNQYKEFLHCYIDINVYEIFEINTIIIFHNFGEKFREY